MERDGGIVSLPSTFGLAGVCNFRTGAEAGGILARRGAEEAAALAAMSPGARLDLLCDTRALHGRLFAGLAPPGWSDVPGAYRGTPCSTVVDAARAVFLARRLPGLRARDLCLPAAEVQPAMEDLSRQLRMVWQDRPGHGDPYRDAAYDALAALTARFFEIHPYMDGNGFVWRMALPALGVRLGLAMRSAWTVDRRPYGPDFSLALQWFPDHPIILSDQLRRWMAPSK